MKYLKILFFSLVIISCQEDSITGIEDSSISNDAQFKRKIPKSDGFNLDPSALKYDNVQDLMERVNSNLASNGLSVRISKLEYLSINAENAGQTVYANNRSLRLNTRWVPNDPRRDADGSNITYLIDDTYRAVNGRFDGAPAIDNSFETWDSATNCSNLPIVKRDFVDGMLPNYVLFSFFGLEGLTNPLVADIVTTGFLPGWLFDAITEEGDGSQYILGVTFTLIWVDGNGDPSDVNNDGYADTALKEVWYNDTFAWSTDGTRRTIDIETVALHENGHALELGHFGKISETIENGKFHFSPRTVMNASYSGIQREVEDIANAAHCSQFGSWPNN